MKLSYIDNIHYKDCNDSYLKSWSQIHHQQKALYRKKNELFSLFIVCDINNKWLLQGASNIIFDSSQWIKQYMYTNISDSYHS